MTNPSRSIFGIHLRYLLLVMWLIGLSVFGLWQGWQLSLLKDLSLASDGQQAGLKALQGELNELRDDLETQQAALKNLSSRTSSPVPDVNTLASLDQRLIALEKSTISATLGQAVTTLQERQTQLEEAIKALQQRNIPSRTAEKTAATRAPRLPAEPPFQLLGIDLRGGAQMLTLLPSENGPSGSGNATSRTVLGEARMIRVGDEINGWKLTALDGHTVTFSVQGQPRTLALPGQLGKRGEGGRQ